MTIFSVTAGVTPDLPIASSWKELFNKGLRSASRCSALLCTIAGKGAVFMRGVHADKRVASKANSKHL